MLVYKYLVIRRAQPCNLLVPQESTMSASESGENQDLLTAQQVSSRLSVSPRTLYRMVARGQFPPPVRYSRKLVRWLVRDLQEYLNGLRRHPGATPGG